MAEITSKYNYHLASYVAPIQEKLEEMEKHAAMMTKGKTIETVINIVYHEVIHDV